MNGLSTLLSNDLQRGFEAGLSSLVPPRRMAVGGENDADTGAYEYTYDPETMTYQLVEKKKKPVEEAQPTTGGDGGPSGFTPPSGKPSGKGFMADLTDAAKGLAGFIGKGGVIGAIGRGLAGALGGGQGLSGLAGLFGGTTGGSVSNTSVGLDGYGGGYDPEAGGTPGVGPSVGTGMEGLSASDAPSEGISVLAHGGVAHAAKGMSMEDNSFIIPADVTAAMGNGSSQAGLRALQQHISPDIQMIRGNGDGMSDSIPANIAGTQPALISDGEAYVPPGVVQAMGGGDMKKGADGLYALMDKTRQEAHGDTKQQRQVNPKKIISKVARA